MLRRTPFARRIYVPPPSAPAGALVRRPSYSCSVVVATVPKEHAVRSEPYRRLVAAGSCKACGWYQCQAAHVPPDGKSIKQDDRFTFPLCIPHPNAQGDLVDGCHIDYDQYRMFPRADAVAQGLEWARQIRQEIIAAGLWPPRLPMLEESNP